MALLLFRLGIYAPRGVLRALGLVQTLRAATQRGGLGPGFLIPRLLRFVLTYSLFLWLLLVVVFIKLKNFFFAYLLMILFSLYYVLESFIGEIYSASCKYVLDWKRGQASFSSPGVRWLHSLLVI